MPRNFDDLVGELRKRVPRPSGVIFLLKWLVRAFVGLVLLAITSVCVAMCIGIGSVIIQMKVDDKGTRVMAMAWTSFPYLFVAVLLTFLFYGLVRKGFQHREPLLGDPKESGFMNEEGLFLKPFVGVITTNVDMIIDLFTPGGGEELELAKELKVAGAILAELARLPTGAVPQDSVTQDDCLPYDLFPTRLELDLGFKRLESLGMIRPGKDAGDRSWTLAEKGRTLALRFGFRKKEAESDAPIETRKGAGGDSSGLPW